MYVCIYIYKLTHLAVQQKPIVNLIKFFFFLNKEYVGQGLLEGSGGEGGGRGDRDGEYM